MPTVASMPPTTPTLPLAFVAKLVAKDDTAGEVAELLTGALDLANAEAGTVVWFALQTDATTAVVSGKDDAMLADSPVVAYAVKQTGGQLEVVGDSYDDAPYGIAVPKDDPDFATAVQGALQGLMDGDRYVEILDEWGVSDGAIDDPQVNPSV